MILEMPIESARRFGRRRFLKTAGGTIGPGHRNGFAGPDLPGGGKGGGKLAQNGEISRQDGPILNVDRPPNLETPLRFYREDLTPNEAFYVRWHLAGLPTRIDTKKFRLSVSGHVEKPQQFSLDDLKTQFEPASLVAVNQCSGNSRSNFDRAYRACNGPTARWATRNDRRADCTIYSAKPMCNPAQSM